MAAIRACSFVTSLVFAAAVQAASADFEVRSADGTSISFECAGSGPELLIVHGGTGDRTRWTPMFPYLSDSFTVCAMDRRGHGKSGDGADYSLELEARDISAVVDSRKRPVTVVGHSFGAVSAFEAAFMNPRIARIILYEPPVRVAGAATILEQMQALVRADRREDATLMFMREIVRVSPAELKAMPDRPTWKALVSSIDGSIRQHSALADREWDAVRVASLRTPTLIVKGERSTNPEILESANSLLETLPDVKLVILPGQEHNAMDSDRETLAATIRSFALPGK